MSDIDAMPPVDAVKRPRAEMDKYFRAVVKMQASDLHLKAGAAPRVRTAGSVKPTNAPVLSNEEHRTADL